MKLLFKFQQKTHVNQNIFFIANSTLDIRYIQIKDWSPLEKSSTKNQDGSYLKPKIFASIDYIATKWINTVILVFVVKGTQC